MIKAIDTFYNGNYYRSRLEARWAYFFDLINVKYVYECDGFELNNGVRYLPDFFLPDMDLYAEVKPRYQSETGHKDNVWSGQWILQHPDYKTKWKPFSEYKSLAILIGNPGEIMITKIPKEFYKYDDIILGIEELFYTPEKSAAIKSTIMKRFEHGSL
jgi:hypothetical protein